MIIKITAFIFDLSTNELSNLNLSKKLSVPIGQTAIARLLMIQSLTVLNQRQNSDCIQLVFFFKIDLFMLIKEQNNSNQSSLLIGPIGFEGGGTRFSTGFF